MKKEIKLLYKHIIQDKERWWHGIDSKTERIHRKFGDESESLETEVCNIKNHIFDFHFLEIRLLNMNLPK